MAMTAVTTATVPPDQASRDRQAEPGAAAGAGGVAPPQPLEDPRQVYLGDAATAVQDVLLGRVGRLPVRRPLPDQLVGDPVVSQPRVLGLGLHLEPPRTARSNL
jgi:hypothetical protein